MFTLRVVLHNDPDGLGIRMLVCPDLEGADRTFVEVGGRWRLDEIGDLGDHVQASRLTADKRLGEASELVGVWRSLSFVASPSPALALVHSQSRI
jgi:hypothetical protein